MANAHRYRLNLSVGRRIAPWGSHGHCLDSVGPGTLQRKLTKRWGKRCARFLKRAWRKEKLANLDTVLQRVLQDHGETTTVGELSAMVGREVGVTLEGKYRAPFDKALSKLTAPPPTQPRARRRFKIANKRAKHDEARNA